MVYTYSSLGRNKIDLVQHEDKMLVRSLSGKVFLNVTTPGSQRISSIDNVQDNI